MSQLFTLTNEIISIAKSAINSLIQELGKDCVLYYPPNQIPCPECSSNGISAFPKAHSTHGSPIPIPHASSCSYCGGTSIIKQEVESETIKCLVQWTPKDYIDEMGYKVRIPDGRIRVKTYLYNLPKLKRMDYMVVQSSLEPYSRQKFKLVSEPTDVANIVQNNYCECFMERSS